VIGDSLVSVQDGELTFETEVYVGGLDPRAVHVELYGDPLSGGAWFRQEMCRCESRPGDSGAHVC
jgi:hypothetical protein